MSESLLSLEEKVKFLFVAEFGFREGIVNIRLCMSHCTNRRIIFTYLFLTEAIDFRFLQQDHFPVVTHFLKIAVPTVVIRDPITAGKIAARIGRKPPLWTIFCFF